MAFELTPGTRTVTLTRSEEEASESKVTVTRPESDLVSLFQDLSDTDDKIVSAERRIIESEQLSKQNSKANKSEPTLESLYSLYSNLLDHQNASREKFARLSKPHVRPLHIHDLPDESAPALL